MNSPFDVSIINELLLRNRFIRSATWEGMCDVHGKPTKKLSDFYKNLTKGGVGLIITGYTYVRQEGKQMPGTMGLYSDDYKLEMKDMVKAVHDEGGKIGIQLVHSGGQADSRVSGFQPVAPSAIKTEQYIEKPKELSVKDIRDIVSSFGIAARRAKEYGFDIAQIHGAHGYLVNQFLSPLTNRRNDEYGGSIEKRYRFLAEVFDCIRKEVGKDYPIIIKLNATDHLDGGFFIEDSLYVAEKLDGAGIDAIEVSSGTRASGDNSPTRTKIETQEQEGYNLKFAKKMKEIVNCPVIAVGGFRSIEVIESAINESNIDFISISRPFIREPHLVNRWKRGDRSLAKCISCNGCFLPGMKRGGIYCIRKKNN